MPVPDPGRPPPPPPPEEAVSVIKKHIFFAHDMYGNGLVEIWGFWDGFECFDGPHDGYANRSNSQTCWPRAIGPRPVIVLP